MQFEGPLWSKPLVFAIDGESEFLLVIREVLEDQGYETQIMPLADHPYEDIARTLPDLIILDFPYRQSLAWSLLNKLDADLTTRGIPVLAVSTDPDNLAAFGNRAETVKPSVTLLKPFALESILARIAEMLPSRAWGGGDVIGIDEPWRTESTWAPQ